MNDLTMVEVIIRAFNESMKHLPVSKNPRYSGKHTMEVVNVIAQEMLPGPYEIYLSSERTSLELLRSRLAWRIIDDSSEAILFELTHR